VTTQRNKVKGQFSYSDPKAGIDFGKVKFTSLVVTGNQARLTGTAKVGQQTVSFIATFIDNGDPGKRDYFSISLSNGYSAGNNLSSGNVQVF
jgi:hypothetical protein